MQATDTQPLTPDTATPAVPAVEYALTGDDLADMFGKSNLPTDAPQGKEPFIIDTLKKLEWWLGRLADKENGIKRTNAQSRELVGRYKTDRNRLDAMRDQAEAFTRDYLQRTKSKRKSIATLEGTCTIRTHAAKFAVQDATALVMWAVENGKTDLFHVTYSAAPALAEFAEAYFKETGELLPGTDNLPAGDSLSITFKGDADADE